MTRARGTSWGSAVIKPSASLNSVTERAARLAAKIAAEKSLPPGPNITSSPEAPEATSPGANHHHFLLQKRREGLCCRFTLRKVRPQLPGLRLGRDQRHRVHVLRLNALLLENGGKKPCRSTGRPGPNRIQHRRAELRF